MADDRGELQRDLSASVEARRELGPAYEAELVQSFVDRVDADIQRRVDERLAQRADTDSVDGDGQQFVVAMVSLGTGIPITAVAADAGFAGTLVAWLGIVGVNAAFAWGRRRGR